MIHIRTEIDVDASTFRVFDVLTDFARWPDWNPVIPTIRTEARQGASVSFRIVVIEGLPALPIRSQMTVFEPGRQMTWAGGLAGVLVGEHFFRVEARGDATRVFHGEDFSGVATGFMPRYVISNLERSYVRLNEALRQEVLRRSPSPGSR